MIYNGFTKEQLAEDFDYKVGLEYVSTLDDKGESYSILSSILGLPYTKYKIDEKYYTLWVGFFVKLYKKMLIDNVNDYMTIDMLINDLKAECLYDWTHYVDFLCAREKERQKSAS